MFCDEHGAVRLFANIGGHQGSGAFQVRDLTDGSIRSLRDLTSCCYSKNAPFYRSGSHYGQTISVIIM